MSAVMSPASNACWCSFSNSLSEFTDTQIFLNRPHSQGSFLASKGILRTSPSRRAPLRMARIDACAPCATILPLRIFKSFRRTMICLCSIDQLYAIAVSMHGLSLAGVRSWRALFGIFTMTHGGPYDHQEKSRRVCGLAYSDVC